MSDEVMGNQAPEPAIADNQAIGTEAEASNEDAILDVLETEANTENTETPKADDSLPRKLKVKIDGQEIEVDEDEAARGYQRQSDYSRNMQRLQAEMQEATQIKARYQQQLEQFIPESVARIQGLQQAAEQYRNEGNMEALAMVQYDLNQEIMRYQSANAESQRIQTEQAQMQQAQMQQNYKMAEQAVFDAIPEWKNPDVRKAEIAEVAKVIEGYVSKYYGNHTSEVMAQIDAGMYGPIPVVLARKAMLYDKLMGKVAARKASNSETTAAPAPVRQVRTSGTASNGLSDKMSADEWMAARNKQVRASNGR